MTENGVQRFNMYYGCVAPLHLNIVPAISMVRKTKT